MIKRKSLISVKVLNNIKTDILVVGAGMAGLMATVAFTKAGFKVICIDAKKLISYEKEDTRTTAILEPGIKLLKYSNIWNKIRDYAQPLNTLKIANIENNEQQIDEIVEFHASEVSVQQFGYNIPNKLFINSLLKFLENENNCQMIWGKSVTKIISRSKESIVCLSEGTKITTRLIIASDGRNSAVRELHQIKIKKIEYGQTALSFTIKHSLPHNNTSSEVYKSGGPCTLVPLKNKNHQSFQSSVIWMEATQNAIEISKKSESEFNTTLRNRIGNIVGDCILNSKINLWPIVSQRSASMYADRTAIIAEAAHVMPPIGAQGFNTSLSDIKTLLDLITNQKEKDIGSETLLRQFELQRIPKITAVMLAVDLLNRISLSKNTITNNVRGKSLKILRESLFLRKTLMKLGLN